MRRIRIHDNVRINKVTGDWTNHSCVHCGLKLKGGNITLSIRRPRAPGNFRIHIDCVEPFFKHLLEKINDPELRKEIMIETL